MNRSDVTIGVFALNRLNLVQSRTRVLRMLRFQAEKIVEDLEQDFNEGGDAQAIEKALKRAEELRYYHRPDQPYSAMAKSFVDWFTDDLKTRS